MPSPTPGQLRKDEMRLERRRKDSNKKEVSLAPIFQNKDIWTWT